MRLLFRYLRVAAQGQLRYRSTLGMSLVVQLALPASMLAGIWMLFARFGSLGGWSAPEALLCFAVVHAAFALAELGSRGFDSFSAILSGAEFDRMLVRPRSLVLQVLGSRLDLARFARLGVAIAVLAYVASGGGIAGSSLDIEWTAPKIAVLALMIACGALLFSGLFILGAAFAFVTVDGLEAVNILTDGGREMCQYPISIYEAPFKSFFTFVVPFACVNYLPLLYVLGKGGGLAAALCPLAGAAFVLPCLAAWRAGVRRYASTGS